MANESFYELFEIAKMGNCVTYYFNDNSEWVHELGRRFYRYNSRTKIRYIMRRNKYKNQYKWD